VGTIMNMLGYELSEKTLQEIIKEVDEDGEWNSTSQRPSVLSTFDVLVRVSYN
jgi:Ca2+-binding EF-hand superfamily protein